MWWIIFGGGEYAKDERIAAGVRINDEVLSSFSRFFERTWLKRFLSVAESSSCGEHVYGPVDDVPDEYSRLVYSSWLISLKCR